MANLVYDLSIVPMLASLKNLDAIVSKAEAFAEADEHLDAATLVQARLYPNMAPFVFHVRVATDTAKGAAARLTGNDMPSWADDESTFQEVHERIKKASDYLSGFEPGQFDGAEDREIVLKIGGNKMEFTGRTYLSRFVLPNFFFHVSTAYCILRHNGLDIGKRDFLGG